MHSKKKDIHDKILKAYDLYPRKMGKSAGMTKALHQCKTFKDACDLEIAVSRYIAYVVSEGTERQYIMYFSTFVNQWRDWLDAETGTTAQVKTDLTGLGFES